jgi:hypothetical protein
VTRSGQHAPLGVWVDQALFDVSPHLGQVFAQLYRLVELGSFSLLLDGRGIAQPDVLELATQLIVPPTAIRAATRSPPTRQEEEARRGSDST